MVVSSRYMSITTRPAKVVSNIEVAELCEAVFGFIRVFGLHRADETPCGVPMSVSEAQALTSLLEGPVTPSELADRLALARSTVSRLLERLDTEGWISRQPDPDDRRSSQVILSPPGRGIAERVLAARHARLARLMANIDEPDRAGVVRALCLLAEAARVD
jgi:DNA-binding MarR family transcriptional regulator